MWDYQRIEKERRDAVLKRYADASREEIIERLIACEAQLYPLYVALSPVLDKSWRGTTASSKLFPMRPQEDEDGFYVYNPEAKRLDVVQIPEPDLSESEYALEESLQIEDGANLADSFELLAFHQQAPGAYVGNGSVSVGDIRRLAAMFSGPYLEHD